jgi:integrase/recombinase XerD
MKVDGNGQGKVLTANELKRLFSNGLITSRDFTLFAIYLFTGCWISKVLSLHVTDIKNKIITFRKLPLKASSKPVLSILLLL